MKLRAIIALMSVALLTLVFALSSGAGPQCGSDPDGDGACDSDGLDNCTAVANSQRDDDQDGYGNVCDWDVDQSCTTGILDTTSTFAASATPGCSGVSPDPVPQGPECRFDVNESTTVGITDTTTVFSKTAVLPGPTSRPCANCLVAIGAGTCAGTPP